MLASITTAQTNDGIRITEITAEERMKQPANLLRSFNRHSSVSMLPSIDIQRGKVIFDRALQNHITSNNDAQTADSRKTSLRTLERVRQNKKKAPRLHLCDHRGNQVFGSNDPKSDNLLDN